MRNSALGGVHFGRVCFGRVYFGRVRLTECAFFDQVDRARHPVFNGARAVFLDVSYGSSDTSTLRTPMLASLKAFLRRTNRPELESKPRQLMPIGEEQKKL
jgi:hypothetical protein